MFNYFKIELYNVSPYSCLSELVKSVQSMELYEEIPNIVSAYDYIIYNCVNLYVELSFSIDQEVFKQANKVGNLTLKYFYRKV